MRYHIRIEIGRQSLSGRPEEHAFDDDSVEFHSVSDEYAGELFVRAVAAVRLSVALLEEAAPETEESQT